MTEPYRVTTIKTAPTAATVRDKDGRCVATVYSISDAKLLAAAPLMKDVTDALLLWKTEPNKVGWEQLLRLAELAQREYVMAGS